MAMRIETETCLRCGACMMACPQSAIFERNDDNGVLFYGVLAEQCNECSDLGDPVCQGECPVPECLRLTG